MKPSEDSFGHLLTRFRQGEGVLEPQLFEVIYDDLRRLAAAVFSRQGNDHVLQPTAVVHEVWMKLSGGLGAVEDRRHFLALAARAMRQVLADYARAAGREKRGGDWTRVTLRSNAIADDSRKLDALDLHDAFEKLQRLDARSAEVAKLRILGSLEVAEIADILGISERTATRDWQVSKLWLQQELRSQ